METEKAKMLAGALYRASDPQLVEERRRAKALCRRYNAAEAVPEASILAELFGYATDACIEPPFFCDYGYNVRIGARFYANHGLIILDVMPVTLGDDVFVAPNVVISTAEHPLDPEARSVGLESARAVRIGDKVWIGFGRAGAAGCGDRRGHDDRRGLRRRAIDSRALRGGGKPVPRDAPPVTPTGRACAPRAAWSPPPGTPAR